MATKPKPKTLRQQAIELANAAFAPQLSLAERNAAAAREAAKLSAQQALGFQTALANASQGDAALIRDAWAGAGNALSGYGNAALASATGAQRGAAEEAQRYIGTVGPVTGAPLPDYTGAMKALGAIGVTDPASELALRAPAALNAALASRRAQLGSIADFGQGQLFRGQAEANKIKADAMAAVGAARPDAMFDAMKYLQDNRRADDENTRQNRSLEIALDQQRLAWAKQRLDESTTATEKAHWQKEYNLAVKKANADIAADKANADEDAASGGLTPYQQTQLNKQANETAAAFYSPKPKTTKNAFGVEQPVPGSDKPLNYQKALKRLQQKYPSFTTGRLVGILNAYYTTPGQDGRPVFSYPERKALMKAGYTKAQITRAMNDYVRALRSGIGDSGPLYAKMAAALGA